MFPNKNKKHTLPRYETGGKYNYTHKDKNIADMFN